MNRIVLRRHVMCAAIVGLACLAGPAWLQRARARPVSHHSGMEIVTPPPAASKASSACTGATGSFADPAEGTTSPATDFTYFGWTIVGNNVRMAMGVPMLTPQVQVDRPGINGAFREYLWGVAIDVDDDTATGSTGAVFYGADYEVSVSYFHQSSTPRLLSLENMQHDVWRYVPLTGGWESTPTEPIFARPFDATYMELSADVPGASSASRLIPYTLWFDPSIGASRLDVLGNCVPTATVVVFRSGFER
jgi:hypothetical protein